MINTICIFLVLFCFNLIFILLTKTTQDHNKILRIKNIHTSTYIHTSTSERNFVCRSVCFSSRFNYCTDLDDIWYINSLKSEKEYRIFISRKPYGSGNYALLSFNKLIIRRSYYIIFVRKIWFIYLLKTNSNLKMLISNICRNKSIAHNIV